MTTSRHVELRRGAYRDSVRLMQISQRVGAVQGVRGALVAMATELNLGLLAGMGFNAPEGATAGDMVVAVAADGDEALSTGLATLTEALAEREGGSGETGGSEVPPRTVGSAVSRVGANLVLISTPGRYAFADAVDALESGASVLLFSDNVPVAQEIALKEMAADRGLLVMGPDCGTAVVGGVGLGFANVVHPGPVGLVAASGTGAQQMLALLDAAGVGVSHCLGVGGRDLSSAVAGRSTIAALSALDADPATELIVVVSKPPAPEIAEDVQLHAATLTTPVLFGLLGGGRPDLTTVAAQAIGELEVAVPDPWPHWPPARDTSAGRRGPALRGLFSGGTLCDEAMGVAAGALGPIASNIPLDGAPLLGPDLRTAGHAMIDFGDDALTAGRPHPMIDGTLRIERLTAEAADASCGVVLLDVVLGHGAHPDPAGELKPAIAAGIAAAAAEGRQLDVIVALIGTTGDPQGLTRQAAGLTVAGADVYASNAEAARAAVALVAGS
jgi:FdrA protein